VWTARNKTDLIFEVWEKLDCASVGSAEIEAIEIVIREEFGAQAVDSPMVLARMLADEGAMLRHSEIMALYLERQSSIPYEAEMRNLFDFSDPRTALRSIRNAENLRKKFASEGDAEGLRKLRELAIWEKKSIKPAAFGAEALAWLTLWIQSPELFDNWIKLRTSAKDFIERFGELKV
jgi:hypothetical protein